MKTYLINSVKGSYWTGDYNLDPLMYDMGTTYNDYLEGKIIELSDEQLQFHIDNPKASVREVIIWIVWFFVANVISTFFSQFLQIHLTLL